MDLCLIFSVILTHFYVYVFNLTNLHALCSAGEITQSTYGKLSISYRDGKRWLILWACERVSMR